MEEKKVCPGCCHKTKDRPEKEYKDLMNRLSRIEGQVRGVRRMVEEGAYCPDILTQVSAFSPPSQFPSGILKKTPPTQQRHCTGFSPVSISDPLISF